MVRGPIDIPPDSCYYRIDLAAHNPVCDPFVDLGGHVGQGASERDRETLRKAALAIAITLLLSLSTAPTFLSNTTSAPGSSSQTAYSGYAPQATDFIYPVGDPRVAPTFEKGNANGFQITQMFNNSCDPALGQGFYLQGEYFCGHTGVDLSDQQEGDPAHAVANGLVVFAGYNSTYGVMVRIQHLLPDGSYIYSQYEHMMDGSLLVGPNQIVTIGQSIGRVGSTGFVTGAHLHFEIKSVNEDGPGYTFGNPALIVGYDEPIQYIAAHSVSLPPTATAIPLQPTAQPVAQPVAQPIQDTPAAAANASSAVTVTDPFSVTPPVSATVALSVTAPTTTSATAPTAPTSMTTTSGSGEAQGVLSNFTKSYTEFVTVSAAAVNVRAGSGYGYTPLNVVTKGARLAYLGLSGDGWVHVALPGGVTGYIARQFVAGAALPKLPPVALDPALHAPFITIVDARYPARNGPLMRDMAVEPLWVGEKLPYLGTDSGSPSWAKVALPSGRLGYILNWYIAGPSVAHDIGGGWHAHGIRPHVTAAPIHPTASAVAPRRPAAPARARFTLTGPFVVTTMDNVNLRVGPRLGAARIEMLSVGTRLRLRGYHVSWAAVTAADGANGYVLASFVNPVGGPAAPAAPRPIAPMSRPTAARHGARVATLAPARSVKRAATKPAVTKPAATKPAVTKPAVTKPAVTTAKRAPRPAARFVVVAVSAANVRAAPDRKATVVVSANQGARLAVRATQGDWVLVQADKGVTGWVMRSLTRD